MRRIPHLRAIVQGGLTMALGYAVLSGAALCVWSNKIAGGGIVIELWQLACLPAVWVGASHVPRPWLDLIVAGSYFAAGGACAWVVATLRCPSVQIACEPVCQVCGYAQTGLTERASACPECGARRGK